MNKMNRLKYVFGINVTRRIPSSKISNNYYYYSKIIQI